MVYPDPEVMDKGWKFNIPVYDAEKLQKVKDSEPVANCVVSCLMATNAVLEMI
jgi:hypothetical protein